MLTGSLSLVLESARDAGRSLTTSLLAVLFLLVAEASMVVAGRLLAPQGMAGGFVLGAIHILFVGWYLALVRISVLTRRTVRPADIREQVGSLFYETMSVAFVFFIAQLVLIAAPGGVVLVATVIAAVVFNPVPELLYQGRTQSIELLRDAATFMQENWPEWLGVNLVVAGSVACALFLVSEAPFLLVLLDVASMFGPFFGFMSAGRMGMQGANDPAVGVAVAAVLGALSHGVMLVRGHLFRRLAGSSRRGRAWQARARG